VPLLIAARDAQLASEKAASGATTAAAAATAATDSAAAATTAAAAGPAAAPPPAVVTPAPAEQPACTICLEPYSAAGGVVPRMLVTCGHSFCEACLDRMLVPLLVRKGRKRLLCPTCRTECAVRGGRARELPTNYDMMGA
jgi:hypothetical protein